ncbi:MAG: hypothetical protein LBH77_02160 [Tannerella sp.]|jgi:hypothetical protein|nr:hypothetical protein [Tannerella sp.]
MKNNYRFVYKRVVLFVLLSLPALLSAQSDQPETLRSLAEKFPAPDGAYHPHVWWHWLGSNFSKEGITKDLEAMKESGIGGATIFNITSSVQESHFPIENNPWPEQTFRSGAYWDAMKHTMKEAQRLGLKIGLHGTPGYSVTGGPWITEERAMKALISSKTVIESKGGETPECILPRPELPEFTGYDSKYTENYKPHKASLYWDITVMAVPDRPDASVGDIIEVAGYMDAGGRLQWQAPAGKWVIYRYGYAPTMAHPHPLPDDIIGKSLEVDKMSLEDNKYHWEELLAPLEEQVGDYFGSTFTYIWVDSYEAGAQNWTPGFREAFIRIKGYDPMPWIALYQFKEKKELEHRFNAWHSPGFESDMPDFKLFIRDYGDVVNRLFIDNGWQVAKEMLHKRRLKFYWEPYGGPFSSYEGAMLADIPVGEFWSSDEIVYGHPHILQAAVDFNKRIIAAEALTGSPIFSRYNEDPAFLKHTVDGGYASGYNLYFLHHWVHQPFGDKYQPGMGMGWWGTHFGRHQTWYKPGKAFFTYMARCQMLLQQGSYVPSAAHTAHRRTPEAEIFFVINAYGDVRKTFAFPVTSREPQLWDAYRGTIRKASRWKQQGDTAYIDLNLGKDESMFVVFPHTTGTYGILPEEAPVLGETSSAVTGAWNVTFQPKLGKPFKRTLPSLTDWSRQKDEALKYFSGTAKYEKTIWVEAADLSADKQVRLDLGELHDIAELEVNGKNAGVLWAPPYRTDITPYLKPGKNKLTVYITNNWANRLIGDEQYPADFEWGQERGEEGRAMKAFPDWFLQNKPRPSKGRKTFNVWYYYKKDSPLHPAGLLGPVQLIKIRN